MNEVNRFANSEVKSALSPWLPLSPEQVSPACDRLMNPDPMQSILGEVHECYRSPYDALPCCPEMIDSS
jgi:hypothetical protein